MRIKDNRSPNWLWFDSRIVTRLGKELGATGVAVYAWFAIHEGADARKLARQGEWALRREIAVDLNAQPHEVLRALQDLRRFGLLDTKRWTLLDLEGVP